MTQPVLIAASIAGLVVVALLGVLLDWLIKPFLPRQLTRKGFFGAFGAITALAVIAVLGPNLSERIAPSTPQASPADQVQITASVPAPTVPAKHCNFPVEQPFLILWESHRQELGCPIELKHVIPTIAEQLFQGGHMFWRSDTDDVYVVLDRTAEGADLSSGAWVVNAANWKWDGSYPGGLGLTPPEGAVEPIRGFGWLWRTHYGGPQGPLGWALDKEYGWNARATVQDFEKGRLFVASDPKIYVLLDTGQFFSNR